MDRMRFVLLGLGAAERGRRESSGTNVRFLRTKPQYRSHPQRRERERGEPHRMPMPGMRQRDVTDVSPVGGRGT